MDLLKDVFLKSPGAALLTSVNKCKDKLVVIIFDYFSFFVGGRRGEDTGRCDKETQVFTLNLLLYNPLLYPQPCAVV